VLSSNAMMTSTTTTLGLRRAHPDSATCERTAHTPFSAPKNAHARPRPFNNAPQADSPCAMTGDRATQRFGGHYRILVALWWTGRLSLFSVDHLPRRFSNRFLGYAATRSLTYRAVPAVSGRTLPAPFLHHSVGAGPFQTLSTGISTHVQNFLRQKFRKFLTTFSSLRHSATAERVRMTPHTRPGSRRGRTPDSTVASTSQRRESRHIQAQIPTQP
jgi:hypothetical protein